MPENPDLTLIPDEAEVWLLLKSDVDAIADKIPTAVTEDLTALGWGFSGLIDAEKGIPLDPSIEIKEYDAFGRPRFRVKAKKGKLNTGFTALEMNDVTRKVVLPGSGPGKIGAPKDVQIYVLYRFVDEDRSTIWVSLTPGLAELSSHGGIIDGELSWAEITVHHTTDAAGDIFDVITDSSDDVTRTITIGVGTTSYTLTVDGDTTGTLTLKTKTAVQSALRNLDSVEALPEPGVTVDGPDGGPLVATFTADPGTTSASGTGGTVTFE